jgi:hypothetical protein
VKAPKNERYNLGRLKLPSTRKGPFWAFLNLHESYNRDTCIKGYLDVAGARDLPIVQDLPTTQPNRAERRAWFADSLELYLAA